MEEQKKFNDFPALSEKPRTSLFIIVSAWELYSLGSGAVLWAIFCPTCFRSIIIRILTALLGIAFFVLGIELRRTKKWAIYTYFILVGIVALYLLFKLRIILIAIHSFLNK